MLGLGAAFSQGMIGQAFANSQPIAIDKGQIGQNSIRPFHVNIPEAAVLVASLLANSCVVMATSVGVKGSPPPAHPYLGDDGDDLIRCSKNIRIGRRYAPSTIRKSRSAPEPSASSAFL